MTQSTTHLSLPYIQEAQAQKHVTHNEAIRALDALVQLAVAGVADAPPADPEDGARWIVGAAPGGAWAGQAGAVAVRHGGPGGWWAFHPPRAGWTAWDVGAGTARVWDGTDWAVAGGGGGERVERLGVGTDADATNRLAVAAPATLLSHDGGDHRVVVNKAGAADTASLLFQSGWSGRAEMGLAGDDGFAVKVSADGAAWATALAADPQAGTLAAPSGTRMAMPARIDGRWDLKADGRWIGFGPLGLGDGTWTAGGGTGASPSTTWSHMGIPVAAGDRLHRLRGMARCTRADLGAARFFVRMQHGPAGGAWSDNGGTVVHAVADAAVPVADGWTAIDVDCGGWAVPADGQVLLYVRPDATMAADAQLFTSLALDVATVRGA